MSEDPTPLPPRWAEVDIQTRPLLDRTRLECLRLSADIGGTEGEVLNRARSFVDFIASAPAASIDGRWVCLRLAVHSLDRPDAGDAIIEAARRYEEFVLRQNDAAPPPPS